MNWYGKEKPRGKAEVWRIWKLLEFRQVSAAVCIAKSVGNREAVLQNRWVTLCHQVRSWGQLKHVRLLGVTQDLGSKEQVVLSQLGLVRVWISDHLDKEYPGPRAWLLALRSHVRAGWYFRCLGVSQRVVENPLVLSWNIFKSLSQLETVPNLMFHFQGLYIYILYISLLTVGVSKILSCWTVGGLLPPNRDPDLATVRKLFQPLFGDNFELSQDFRCWDCLGKWVSKRFQKSVWVKSDKIPSLCYHVLPHFDPFWSWNAQCPSDPGVQTSRNEWMLLFSWLWEMARRTFYIVLFFFNTRCLFGPMFDLNFFSLVSSC